MRKILYLSIMLVAVSVQAKTSIEDKKLDNKKLAVGAKFGGTISNTETRSGQTETDKELFLNLDLNARYALDSKFALNGGMTKWLGTGAVSSRAGSFATSFNLGIDVAITGNLISQELSYKRKSSKEIKKDNTMYLINNTIDRNLVNKTDGWRLGAHGSQLSFSKIDSDVYSFGGSLYYEHRLNKSHNHIQYGIKYDSINSSKISANLLQVYIGLITFP
jgi:hypothetical protein